MPTRNKRGKKTKSKQQVKFLLSKVSPLSAQQKNKLKKELHSGAVKIKNSKKKKSKK